MIQLGIIKKCRPRDRTAKRPAGEQRYCLWSRKKPKKLLGRHRTIKSAKRQERAIQARKRRG